MEEMYKALCREVIPLLVVGSSIWILMDAKCAYGLSRDAVEFFYERFLK